MFEPMFKKLSDTYYDLRFESSVIHRVKKLSLLIWSGDADKLYQHKTLIYGAATSEEGDIIVGYCNPEGFWYLREDKLFLCKWNQTFNELGDYGFEVLSGFSYNSSGFNITELRRELERTISLVSMTKMYENRLVPEVELMR